MAEAKPSIPELNWPTSPGLDATKEVASQANAMLAAQLTLALAVDTRAAAQASVLAALGTALLGAAVAYQALQGHDPIILIALFVAALGELVAAALSGYAARPCGFFLEGYPPKVLSHWTGDEIAMHRFLAESRQVQIDTNAQAFRHTAKWTSRAFVLGAAIILALGVTLAIAGSAGLAIFETNRAVHAEEKAAAKPAVAEEAPLALGHSSQVSLKQIANQNMHGTAQVQPQTRTSEAKK